MKIGAEGAQDTSRRSMCQATCIAQFITHQKNLQQHDSILKSSNIVNAIFSAMPRSFLRISICNFQPRVRPARANKSKACPIFYYSEILFQRNYRRFCIFSGRCIGHISGTKRGKNSDRLSSCWLVHDKHRVKKSRPNS